MKLGQDRHGDWDDKRVFGWATLAVAIVAAFVLRDIAITSAFLGAALVAFGLSVADKD